MPRLGRNALLHSFPELSTWGETFSSHLNRTLQLYAREGIRIARGAIAHMRVESAHLLLRNLSVQLGVEFCLPGFTNHVSSPYQFVVPLLVSISAAVDSYN